MNEGDPVQVAAREQTPADIKSGLYYPHFAGMRGTILKLYGEEASVLVERVSLPTEVRGRHIESEKAMRQRWLDGMSEEARGRLTQREKDFALNYAILVSLKDLMPAPDIADTVLTDSAHRAATSVSSSKPAESSGAALQTGAEPAVVSRGETIAEARARITAADLDAAEAAFLAKVAAAGEDPGT